MTKYLEISEALMKAQTEVRDPERRSSVTVTTKKGGKYGFKYATFNQGLDIFRQIYCKHGLAFTQGVAWIDGRPHIETTIYHKSGETIVTQWPISGFDCDNPQAGGSATTYAKRYALFAAMGINGDDDEDGNIASGNQYKHTESKKVAEEIEQKNTDKYDELFNRSTYKVERGDMNQSEFIYELARYAKRANNCAELDKLIADNIKEVSDFEDNAKKAFIRYLDANYKEIDENAEFPVSFEAQMAGSLS